MTSLLNERTSPSGDIIIGPGGRNCWFCDTLWRKERVCSYYPI